MANYALGVDYGTLSGRTVLVDIITGEEAAQAEYAYPHGVMDEALPDGTPLAPDWALQHPQDYLDVLAHTVPEVLAQAGVDPADVIGIGTDFTACTMIPVTGDGTPLCLLPAYRREPHAYVKLWKHHAAQGQANRINALAAERGEAFLPRYGGKISSEWELPKLLQILEEAPAVYEAMDAFVEAADWIVWQMTGRRTRNSCAAGYKGLWHKVDGDPSPAFLAALHPAFGRAVEEKLACPVSPLGQRAGGLTAEMAALTGLHAGTPVAVGNVDAHVCVPAVKIDRPGHMLAIMGTSTCHMLLSQEERPVPGVCGVVEDGILPGYYGYEAGQSCCGDHFAWFTDNCLPAAYTEQAAREGKSIHAYLREKAARLAPGESGLIALDWWNGSRSVLMDADLSGLLLGMTLRTKPEDIYRALIEATAYGTRMIVETFRKAGVAVDGIVAAGGIPRKDPMTMQIYADVLDMPIRVAGSAQCGALGAAIFGAVAAGAAGGGYDRVQDAATAMGKLREGAYRPDAERAAVYDRLYAEYVALHDAFGRGASDVMKRLKALRLAAGHS